MIKVLFNHLCLFRCYLFDISSGFSFISFWSNHKSTSCCEEIGWLDISNNTPSAGVAVAYVCTVTQCPAPPPHSPVRFTTSGLTSGVFTCWYSEQVWLVEGSVYRELWAQGLDKHPLGKAQENKGGGGGREVRIYWNNLFKTSRSICSDKKKKKKKLDLKLWCSVETLRQLDWQNKRHQHM